MATEITNMFCRLNDLNNEAEVETFLVNRLLTRLGYPDSRIRTKESIESLPIPRGSSTEHYRPDYVLLDSGNSPVIVVDAKHPSEPIDSWIYQVVGYAGAVNRAFPSGVNPSQVCCALQWPYPCGVPMGQQHPGLLPGIPGAGRR